MKKLLIFLLFFLTFNTLKAEEKDLFFPKTVNFAFADEAYKNLQWNRYTTKNFTVISIDNKDGQWLFNNLDALKQKCINKWGITNIDFSAECRIMIVNDKDLFKKFFNLSEPRIEIRKKDNKTDIIGVWLCLVDKDYEDLEKVISEICFKDMLDKKERSKKFLEEGISLLSQPANKIKNLIDEGLTFDFSFLNKNEEDYKKMSENEKRNFSANSLTLCLMLRKEFGERKFLKLMFSKGDILSQIIEIYGYKNKEDFEKTFKRYCLDLKDSIKKSDSVDRYFKIERSLK